MAPRLQEAPAMCAVVAVRPNQTIEFITSRMPIQGKVGPIRVVVSTHSTHKGSIHVSGTDYKKTPALRLVPSAEDFQLSVRALIWVTS